MLKTNQIIYRFGIMYLTTRFTGEKIPRRRHTAETDVFYLNTWYATSLIAFFFLFLIDV